MGAAPARTGKPTVLVTGATGFIGTALCRHLTASGGSVRGAARSAGAPGTTIAVGDIGTSIDWSAALAGIEHVVHLAGWAHVAACGSAALAAARRVNVDGTRRLAEAAAAAGVRRLLFLSSVKVNGETTDKTPFAESDPPRPEDAYGITKWEAEQALRQVAAQSRIEIVVLRAPLVYGAGVKGNFLRLMDFVARGVPLPLASVRNRRSLVYLGNLIDAIAICLAAPRAAGRTYFVSDGEDVSTPVLVRALGGALGTPARLIPCPVTLLRLAAALVHRADIEKLTGSLQIDTSRIRNDLGWRAPCSLPAGLQETARWYLGRAAARTLARS
jgi:nucleoside-diphosphate-sugar epimerase